MPITSQRVIRILKIGATCVEHTNRLREVIKYAVRDIEELMTLDPANDRELILDRLSAMRAMIGEAGMETEIAPSEVQNLYYEKAKFEINEKKNAGAARRMRVIRGIRRDREEMGKTGYDNNEQESLQESPLSPGEVMERIEQGEKREPEKADNSIPHAARSERIPTADDEDSWKPKEKKGEE